MGLTRTTPIPALNVESNAPPVKIFITKHKLNYIARRQISRDTNLANQIKCGKLSDSKSSCLSIETQKKQTK